MDGINGITGGYSLAMLIPLIVKNEELRVKSGQGFVEPSLLVVMAAVFTLAYILFKIKYYHLHEEYLESLKKVK